MAKGALTTFTSRLPELVRRVMWAHAQRLATRTMTVMMIITSTIHRLMSILADGRGVRRRRRLSGEFFTVCAGAAEFRLLGRT